MNTSEQAFNHLPVQEYFCALYISLLPEDEQLQLLKHHIWYYPHMWPFYAGVTKLRSSDVSHYLCQFLLQDYCDFSIYANIVALNSIYEAQLPSDDCKDYFLYQHTTIDYFLMIF